MNRFFGHATSNVDVISDQKNDRMSRDQLYTFLEIINSQTARKVAKSLFGCECAVRTANFIQWIERAIRDELFSDGAPLEEEELLKILQQVRGKTIAKNIIKQIRQSGD